MKVLALALLVLAFAAAVVGAQQCVRKANGWSCSRQRHLCCSQSRWCGPSVDYCGDGCMGGACYASRMCGKQAGGAQCWKNRCCSQHGWCGDDASYCGLLQLRVPERPVLAPRRQRDRHRRGRVAAVVTRDLFDHMLPHGGGDPSACPARGFYTYEAFVAATGPFPTFAAAGDHDARKREVAAFLAHGWRGYCYKEEVNVSKFGIPCVPQPDAPCGAPWGKYHPRGPAQIAYNYNYGPAGRAIGANLLERPDLVTSDPVVAFQTALWLWMTPRSPGQPSAHDAFTARLALGSP